MTHSILILSRGDDDRLAAGLQHIIRTRIGRFNSSLEAINEPVGPIALFRPSVCVFYASDLEEAELFLKAGLSRQAQKQLLITAQNIPEIESLLSRYASAELFVGDPNGAFRRPFLDRIGSMLDALDVIQEAPQSSLELFLGGPIDSINRPNALNIFRDALSLQRARNSVAVGHDGNKSKSTDEFD